MLRFGHTPKHGFVKDREYRAMGTGGRVNQTQYSKLSDAVSRGTTWKIEEHS